MALRQVNLQLSTALLNITLNNNEEMQLFLEKKFLETAIDLEQKLLWIVRFNLLFASFDTFETFIIMETMFSWELCCKYVHVSVRQLLWWEFNYSCQIQSQLNGLPTIKLIRSIKLIAKVRVVLESHWVLVLFQSLHIPFFIATEIQ